MSTIPVRLHDGTELTATVQGTGPAVLLAVRTKPYDDDTAETMRQWGADPTLGRTLVDGLSDRYQVIAADYEGHRMAHPAPETLTPDSIAADFIAIADAVGVDRFAYYGYSWLALSGLQLAIRTARLSALVMGGFPPVDGPYESMLAVTRAAHKMANEPSVAQTPATDAIEPGDWDAVTVQADPAQTKQFVTLYEALQDFRDDLAQRGLTVPRLVFAGSEDNIEYGALWGNTTVKIAEPIAQHRAELIIEGWDVELLPGLDHISAMHSQAALPVLRRWLYKAVAS